MLRKFSFSLLAASALVGGAPAQAQDAGSAADIVAELRALRAEVQALRTRVDELEGDQTAAAAASTPQVQLATMTTAQPQPAQPAQAAQPARDPGPQIGFRGAPT